MAQTTRAGNGVSIRLTVAARPHFPFFTADDLTFVLEDLEVPGIGVKLRDALAVLVQSAAYNMDADILVTVNKRSDGEFEFQVRGSCDGFP